MHVANILNNSQHETSTMLPNGKSQEAQSQEAAELSKVQDDETEEAYMNCKMSNQLVLQITCASFLIFVLAEVAGAIIGKSWSLLGDAAAMSVDVMTYFCNMHAERIKAKKGYVPPSTKMILEVCVYALCSCLCEVFCACSVCRVSIVYYC